MPCCGRRVYNTENSAHLSNQFADELSTIFNEDVRWDAERGFPIVKEDIRNVRDCCSKRWDSSSELEISVGNDEYVLDTMSFWEMVPHCFLRQSVVVRTMGRAAVYANGAP